MSSVTKDEISNTSSNDVSNSTPKLDLTLRKMQNLNFSFLHQFPLFNFFFPNQDATKQQETIMIQQNTQKESKSMPNPLFVKFPTTLSSVPSLKLEDEESSEKEERSNPVVLWQVYVLGGILVGRWLISRWQERSSKNNPPPKDDPPQEFE